MSELVTIATFRDVHQAELAHGKLAAAGITSFLANENIVRLNWFWSTAVGGVKLQVSEDDVQTATGLLHMPVPPGFEPDEVGEKYESPRCPECGSQDISYRAPQRWMSLVLLWFTGLPVYIPAGSQWRCEECGAQWVGGDKAN